ALFPYTTLFRSGLDGAGHPAGGVRPHGVPLRALVDRRSHVAARRCAKGAGMIVAGLLLVLLALLGAPLFAVIAASAMLGYYREGYDLAAIAIDILGLAEIPFLSAIPLFTFAG